MTTDSQQAWVTDANSGETFEIEIQSDDPWFEVVSADLGEGADRALRRGSLLALEARDDALSDTREIVGVSVVSTAFYGCYDLLAPRRIASAIEPQKYIRLRSAGGDGPFSLRPGTAIIGGRRSGFYDSEGLILSAQYIGGDPKRFEDWVYLVAADDESVANWVPLDDINIALAGPERVFAFPGRDGADPDGDIVDMLIRMGERELIDYLSASQRNLARLSPRQFELTTQSIYKNLGFDVEPMGNWNQGDGGVDFIAVSKSLTGGEIRTAVQCKVSKNKISARPMRELAGVMPRFEAQQGVVVTTSTFTEPARQERDDWFVQVELSDRMALYEKIQEIMGAWAVKPDDDDGPLIGFGLTAMTFAHADQGDCSDV